MSDIGEVYEAHRKEKQARRASNRERSADLLKQEGIEFDSKNGGAHLIVQGSGCVFDFWPGTGKYTKRGGYTVRGVFNLIKAIKKTYAP